MRILNLFLALATLAFAGCQTYQPWPLDDDEVWQDWQDVDLNREGISVFSERLQEVRGEVGLGNYDPSDGFNLGEAEAVALLYNPYLRQARFEAKVPLVSAQEGGRWDAPSLSVDIAHILESVSDPWVIGGGVGFTIPLSGRLEAEEDKAYAEASVEFAKVRIAEWEMLHELRLRWSEHASVMLEMDMLTQLRSDIEAVKRIADALADAGEIARSDARIFEIELAELRGETLELESHARTLELEIKALMGVTPDAPLELHTSMGGVDSGELIVEREAMQKRNLTLRKMRAEYQVAEEALRVEIRKQYPDLQIGPSYESDEGQSKIGLGLGIPLPLINLNEQGIAEAYAQREAVRAAYEAAYKDVFSEYAQVGERVRFARERQAYIVDEIAPLVDRQLLEIEERTRLGEFDTLMTLDALNRQAQSKRDLLAAVVERQRAEEVQRFTIGPSIPTAPSEEEAQ